MYVNNAGLCKPLTGSYSIFFNKIWLLIDLCVAFAVPFTSIFVGNMVIIYKLYQRRRRRLNMVCQYPDSQRNESSLTVMLIVVNVWFMICMAPMSLFNVLYKSDNENKYKDSTFVFWFEVLTTLANMNAVGNFYLYFLSGKSFRKQVNIFFKECSCRRNSQNDLI